ncbi:MAG: regulatory protein LexA, partial [Candidatus Krumholzibacteriota bacterium]|nr:regulatory protein LexA [Candidatus Krumholzibacteriota bacterium]
APSKAAPPKGTSSRLTKARGAQPPQQPGSATEDTGLSVSSYQATQPTGSGQLFALRVHGESMIGAGILPGDLVIVRSQATAQSGEIVVALIGDEATVKRLRLRRGRIELHPENPAFEPIIPGPNECTILGKVIEIRRHLEPPAR